MELNLTPVKVDIVTEIPTTTKDAFYNLCFIADNNEAPRTIEITQLDDLLSNGYKVTDSAYDFCNSVFLQNGIDKVYIRAKRSGETYEEAFDADDNSTYYYCVIQSKDISVVLKFNDYINTVDQFKLQFFSSKDDVSELIKNRKIVFYFDETNPSEKHTIYASRLYPVLIDEDAYVPSIKPLDITLQDILKRGYGEDAYQPTVKPLDITLQDILKHTIYASRPYPTLIDEDAYQPTVKPLDITLQDILKRGYGEDAYQPTIKPLDITMRDIVLSKQVDDKDAYQPTVKPLDITLKSIVSKANVDDKDAYQATIKPLDITLKRVVVSNNVDGDAYQPTVKPLDITLKTV